MFEVNPSILIEAPIEKIWAYMLDIENWWLRSNPEHIYLELLSGDKQLQLGSKITIKEKVGGIPCTAVGCISKFEKYKQVTWEAEAVYKYMGMTVQVQEGVDWLFKPIKDKYQLEAHVWAVFPKGFKGKMLEWYAKTFLKIVEKDYEHAMIELEYIKIEIEKLNR